MRVSASVCACLQPCVQVCAYMCASVCLQAVCGAEQSRERKTDRSVTAHFPAHYRQQGLMGAYNEGPCLGLVKGEHSPNSTHPSSAPFRPPPSLLLLYATVYPQRLVILPVPLLLLSAASHPPPLSHLFASSSLSFLHPFSFPAAQPAPLTSPDSPASPLPSSTSSGY